MYGLDSPYVIGNGVKMIDVFDKRTCILYQQLFLVTTDSFLVSISVIPTSKIITINKKTKIDEELHSL